MIIQLQQLQRWLQEIEHRQGVAQKLRTRARVQKMMTHTARNELLSEADQHAQHATKLVTQADELVTRLRAQLRNNQ